MMTVPKTPTPPRHLSPAARRLFSATLADYQLEPFHIAILTKSLEAFDRAEQARKLVESAGILVESRLGGLVANPAVAIERDSRAAFLAGMKQLGLDYEPVGSQARTAAARAARWSA
jgi:phage terminase small subunit